jgi:hypothetical protein
MATNTDPALKRADPVFIHSLFRSGSTYLFNVFRRSPAGYTCYQEPLNEFLLCARTEPEKLLAIHEAAARTYRHPKLDRPYFAEFHIVADEVGRLYRKEFAYDQYFAQSAEEVASLKEYFGMLCAAAKGSAVFQCCRSSGRLATAKQECGGTHIYLWRNPWDQWWSSKVDLAFDVNYLLVANARHPPAPLAELRRRLGIPEFHDPDIHREREFFFEHRLDARGSYALFFLLWCLAANSAASSADLVISIDELAASPDYQDAMRIQLAALGIHALDFSDCRVPRMAYGSADRSFFADVEAEVLELMRGHGIADECIETLRLMSRTAQGATPESVDQIDLVDSQRQEILRTLARRQEDEIPNLLTALTQSRSLVERSEAVVRVAEEHAAESDRRAVAAEQLAQAAIARGEAAEVWASDAERRAIATASQLASVEQQLAATRQALGATEMRLSHAAATAEQVHQQLQAVYKSHSWRITAPLRKLLDLLNTLVSGQQRRTWIRTAQDTMIAALRFALRQPALVAMVHGALRRVPRLHRWMIAKVGQIAGQPQAPVAHGPATMTATVASVPRIGACPAFNTANPDPGQVAAAAADLAGTTSGSIAKVQFDCPSGLLL